MAAIYSGSTPKYLIRIKDKNGVQLDPGSSSVIDVRVIIWNADTGVIFARFYLKDAPDPIGDYKEMEVKTIATGDNRVMFVLESSQTEAATGGANRIQITASIVDEDAPNSRCVIIKQGAFHEINKSKS